MCKERRESAHSVILWIMLCYSTVHFLFQQLRYYNWASPATCTDWGTFDQCKVNSYCRFRLDKGQNKTFNQAIHLSSLLAERNIIIPNEVVTVAALERSFCWSDLEAQWPGSMPHGHKCPKQLGSISISFPSLVCLHCPWLRWVLMFNLLLPVTIACNNSQTRSQLDDKSIEQLTQCKLRCHVQSEASQTHKAQRAQTTAYDDRFGDVRSAATFRTFRFGCGFSKAHYLKDKISLRYWPFSLFKVHFKHLLFVVTRSMGISHPSFFPLLRKCNAEMSLWEGNSSVWTPQWPHDKHTHFTCTG